MPTNLKIKAVNLKEWQRLAKATGKAFHAPDVIRNVGTMLTRRWQLLSRKQFESEGATGGGRWPALSPKYAAQKRRQFGGKTILRKSDRMFRSFVTRRENIAAATRAGKGFVYRYGSTVPIYPEAHQKGLGAMPQRSVLNPTSQQLKGISAAIGRTVVEGVFKRKWFDSQKGGLRLSFINTGFSSIDIPEN